MPDSSSAAIAREPRLTGGASGKEGIVISTAIRLTTTDGHAFEDPAKALEHEAFYQILKRLVTELGQPDNEATAAFALTLAKHYRRLLPVLAELDREADAVSAKLRAAIERL